MEVIMKRAWAGLGVLGLCSLFLHYKGDLIVEHMPLSWAVLVGLISLALVVGGRVPEPCDSCPGRDDLDRCIGIMQEGKCTSRHLEVPRDELK